MICISIIFTRIILIVKHYIFNYVEYCFQQNLKRYKKKGKSILFVGRENCDKGED